MPFVSARYSSGPYKKNWVSEEECGLVKQLYKAGEFLRGFRVELRFGNLSRAPLRLVRLYMLDKVVECDWLARSPDPWDAHLSRNVQKRHASLQSLRDAIDVRALLFDLMPQVETAYFRVFRESPGCRRETIITGCTHRNDHTSRDVHSLAMRAKILGFRFDLKDDTLLKISTEETVKIDGQFDGREIEHYRWEL